MSTSTPIFVVAGVGSENGPGAASARVFANAGYGVAIIGLASNSAVLKKVAEDINKPGGGKAGAFPVASYKFNDLSNAFSSMRHFFTMQRPFHTAVLRAALFCVAASNSQPFLTINPKQVQDALDVNLIAAFAFSREVMYMFKENEEDEIRGTLIFAGAEASLKGTIGTSAFSASTAGARALSQSLYEEFGRDGIHVLHALIDGATPNNRQIKGTTFEQGHDPKLDPEYIATAYLQLIDQDKSLWEAELDLRPKGVKL